MKANTYWNARDGAAVLLAILFACRVTAQVPCASRQLRQQSACLIEACFPVGPFESNLPGAHRRSAQQKCWVGRLVGADLAPNSYSLPLNGPRSALDSLADRRRFWRPFVVDVACPSAGLKGQTAAAAKETPTICVTRTLPAALKDFLSRDRKGSRLFDKSSAEWIFFEEGPVTCTKEDGCHFPCALDRGKGNIISDLSFDFHPARPADASTVIEGLPLLGSDSSQVYVGMRQNWIFPDGCSLPLPLPPINLNHLPFELFMLRVDFSY